MKFYVTVPEDYGVFSTYTTAWKDWVKTLNGKVVVVRFEEEMAGMLADGRNRADGWTIHSISASTFNVWPWVPVEWLTPYTPFEFKKQSISVG